MPGLIQLALSKGADVNAKNEEGRTPLDCVRSGDHVKEVLVAHGATSGR